MKKTPFAVQISPSLRNRVKTFCQERGYKQGAFVERALEEMLEQEENKEDILDLKRLRTEEERAIPLEDYLKHRSRV